MSPALGVPLVGEEGVGHLTLGNPWGLERQDEKAHQRTCQRLAACYPICRGTEIGYFYHMGKKNALRSGWRYKTTCAVGRFANQILLKMSLVVSFSGTPP